MASLPSKNPSWRAIIGEAFADIVSQEGHPDEETIAAYAEGNLLPEQREKHEGHLSKCPSCLEVTRGLWSQLKAEPTAVPLYRGNRTLRFLTAASLFLAVVGTVWAVRQTLVVSGFREENSRLQDRLAETKLELANAFQDSFLGAFPSSRRGYWVGQPNPKTLQLPVVRGAGTMTPEAKAEFDQAIRAFQEIAEDPKNRNKALLNLAFLHTVAGEFAHAERFLILTEQLAGDSADVMNARAVWLLTQGNKETANKALVLLEEVTRTSADYLPAWYNLAIAYGRVFRDEDAKRTWQEYLRRETRVDFRKAAEAHLGT